MRLFRRTAWAGVWCAIAISTAGCSRSAETYVARGDAAVARGDLASAVLEYRNAVEKEPLLAAARVKLGEAYLRQGSGDRALAEFVRAADLLPKDVDAQLKAATLLGAAGRFEDARSRGREGSVHQSEKRRRVGGAGERDGELAGL